MKNTYKSMSTVRNVELDPSFIEMPLIKVDSEVLTSLLEKTKKLTKDLETILNQADNVETKSIIVRKPLDFLTEIQKEVDQQFSSDEFDPYPYILRLADPLGIYAISNQKIGNDFKHLFETLFVKLCKKLRSMDFAGLEGLNTVFLTTVCKVRDIKWLLQVLACYSCATIGVYDNLFTFTKQHLEEYSKIGSRDCQVLMHKLIPTKATYGYNQDSLSFSLFTKEATNTCDLPSLIKWVEKGATLGPWLRKCKCSTPTMCFKSECYDYTHNLDCEIRYTFNEWINSKNVYMEKVDVEKRCSCIAWLLTSHTGGYIFHDIISKTDERRLAHIEFLEKHIPNDVEFLKILLAYMIKTKSLWFNETSFEYLKSKAYLDQETVEKFGKIFRSIKGVIISGPSDNISFFGTHGYTKPVKDMLIEEMNYVQDVTTIGKLKQQIKNNTITEGMNCAVYIGTCTDVGKVALLPSIKEWIMIDELPCSLNSGATNKDGRFSYFFQKLKKAFEHLVSFTTTSAADDAVWIFENKSTKQTVRYYHSIWYPSFNDRNDLIEDFKKVDTIVHSGAFETEKLLEHCPDVKFYITSGDGTDSCGPDTDCSLQRKIESFIGTSKEIEMFFLDDFLCSNLLFWNVLFNEPIDDYIHEFNGQLRSIKALKPIKSLKTFFSTEVASVYKYRMELLFRWQSKFSVANNEEFEDKMKE